MNDAVKNSKADVLVFGADPAGISASIHAQRQGVGVILVDSFPYVGGMSTLVLVSMWPIVSAVEIGELEQSFGGFPQEVIERLKEIGGIEQRGVISDGVDS